MKRALSTLLTLPLALVFACGPAKNVNSNANLNANASSNTNQGVTAALQKTDKTVQIFISDGSTPGTYIIEQPCPVTIHKAKNQKIVWCIVYDGQFTPPTNVIIDEFRSPPPPAAPTATNPFGDGTDPDNMFNIPYTSFDCQVKTKPAKPSAPLATFKYRIRAFVTGDEKGSLDPQVIIDN
ncbi:MAG TPA: hypothetical protein VNO24_20565 [Blastocatellia bacterium]|nr:hypothetical protein [Blastocatellia bacterium]